jgi:hypothetical protein
MQVNSLRDAEAISRRVLTGGPLVKPKVLDTMVGQLQATVYPGWKAMDASLGASLITLKQTGNRDQLMADVQQLQEVLLGAEATLKTTGKLPGTYPQPRGSLLRGEAPEAPVAPPPRQAPRTPPRAAPEPPHNAVYVDMVRDRFPKMSQEDASKIVADMQTDSTMSARPLGRLLDDMEILHLNHGYSPREAYGRTKEISQAGRSVYAFSEDMRALRGQHGFSVPEAYYINHQLAKLDLHHVLKDMHRMSNAHGFSREKSAQLTYEVRRDERGVPHVIKDISTLRKVGYTPDEAYAAMDKLDSGGRFIGGFAKEMEKLMKRQGLGRDQAFTEVWNRFGN